MKKLSHHTRENIGSVSGAFLAMLILAGVTIHNRPDTALSQAFLDAANQPDYTVRLQNIFEESRRSLSLIKDSGLTIKMSPDMGATGVSIANGTILLNSKMTEKQQIDALREAIAYIIEQKRDNLDFSNTSFGLSPARQGGSAQYHLVPAAP